MSRPRRVFGYARVSSAAQALGTSLADQQAAIAAYAHSRGLTVDRFFVEAESAVFEKIERREQILTLLRTVESGDLVLVAKVDRWSRDPGFTYDSVKKLITIGADFYAVDDRIDARTPDGDTALGFRILFAREEHKRIRERTIGTRNILRAQGYYVEGTPPFGYRRSRPKGSRGADKNILVIVPEHAALVRKMFRMSAAGKSLTTICTELGLSKKRVWSSLHCRSYLGEIRTDAGWVKALHEPILDATLFERASAAFSARRHGGARHRSTPALTDSWVLRDLARCGHCGAKMSAAYGGSKRPARRFYYKCYARCQTSYVPVLTVEAAVVPMVFDRLDELRAELGKGPEPVPAPTIDFAGRRAKLDRRRKRHLEAHADDLMTREELRAVLEKVEAERRRVDADEAAAAPARLASASERRSTLRGLGKLAEAWRKANPGCRRAIAAQLIAEVRMKNGEPPVVIWRGAEDLFAEQ